MRMTMSVSMPMVPLGGRVVMMPVIMVRVV
jgi:hypothetical protein